VTPPVSRKRSRRRSGSTAGSSASRDATEENGTALFSRAPWLLAWFVRIEKIHVPSAERPSKRSIPATTAIQVSCTTSSATASEATYVRATRFIIG